MLTSQETWQNRLLWNRIDFYGDIRLLKQQNDGQWTLEHTYSNDQFIWHLGFDFKNENLLIGPHSQKITFMKEIIYK